jgi:hypothetical protein
MALLKVIPGDIVAIPCKKGEEFGFVISRVIRDDVILWIEVFTNFFTDFQMTFEDILLQDFSIQNRLFNPIYASFDFNRFSGKIKWPILAHYPDYDPEMHSMMSCIEFQDTSYSEIGLYMKGGKPFYEPACTRRNLEDRTIFSNTQLIARICLYLSGYLKQGTIWNHVLVKRLLEKEGNDWWKNQIIYCASFVDIVAQKFKDARKSMKQTANKRK